ncbi:hypothetical protein ES332_A03G179900v1 [Gossypium tomentosum]|nr:hypothetical protein ES332_A03G179900v1 [Gossypium tomentosum]
MELRVKEEGKKVALLSTLAALLDDPILADISKKPSFSDVDTLINLELGSGMCISIVKLDGTFFDVAVMNSATVKDLKLTIKKKVIELEQSKMGHQHISWRHVWANFYLANHNEILVFEIILKCCIWPSLKSIDLAHINLNKIHMLMNYGNPSSRVHFLPYVVSKGSGRHSKRRKHQFFHGLNKH